MTNAKQKSVSLLSGGLDSTVATAMFLRGGNVLLALTFDYGQRAAVDEIGVSRALCLKFGIEHKVIPLPWLKEITNTALVNSSKPLPSVNAETVDNDARENASAVWVPNRNSIFISIAAAFAEAGGADTIIAGFNAEEAETFPDNSKEFVNAENESLKISTFGRVRIESPVLEMTKEEIAKNFVSLELDANNFWCCYDKGSKFCGRCESCARTIRAFRKIGAWEMVKGRFE